MLLFFTSFNWFCCFSFISDMVVDCRVGLSDCRVQSSKFSDCFLLVANDCCTTGGLLGNPQIGLLKIRGLLGLLYGCNIYLAVGIFDMD